jgi:hypothetical protein
LDDPASWSRFIAPQRNWVQQTFEHDLVPDRDGRVHVAIVNMKLGKEGTGVAVSYDKRAMPRYIEWRMMAEGQYVVGIEPCTNGFGRSAVKAAGELITLKPGETRRYRTELVILDGAAEIEGFRKKVASAMIRPRRRRSQK